MTTENKKTVDAIVALAKSLTKEEDEAERKKLLDTLRDVAYSIESPEDTMQRIMFYVKKKFTVVAMVATKRTDTPNSYRIFSWPASAWGLTLRFSNYSQRATSP